MKIAFFVQKFPAISETFILNQITGLIDSGHEIDIYSARSSDEVKIHPDVEKYNLLKKTHYIDIPKNRALRFFKGFEFLLRNFCKNPRMYLNILDIIIHGKKTGNLFLFYLANYFNKDYDIVHCHFGPIGLNAVMLKEIKAPVKKIITTFHASDLTVFLKNKNSDVYEDLFKHGDLFLPISQRWKKRLVELGCDENRIMVHHMGVDFRSFKYKPRVPAADGEIRIISVARLVEKKGIEFGIQAVSRLVKSNQKIKYNIIGDGPLKNEYQKLIQSLGVDKNIKLSGWKRQSEVMENLDKSHILLAPSVTAKDGDQEGIPLALMEAMAMGLPVISTLHSGIPELIENGVTGFLVPEKDASALFHTLKYLIQNPDLCLTI
ncbi:MAG: glycosyltransferase, partial [Desulfosarcina sp.]|nr:glycosyltransferase [Desulfobacterales bacterium]